MEEKVGIEDIAVIIVVYHPNERQMGRVTQFASIYNGVVYDNTPGCVRADEKNGKMVYMSSGENIGIAAAQNRAVARLQGFRYFVFLDQDTKVDYSYPSEIANEYLRCKYLVPHLAALGPDYTDGKSQNTYKSKIHKDKYLSPGLIIRKNIISSGSCVESDVFAEIGGYEERLFIDYVDSEWCWRAISKGYICCITERLTMVHQIGNRVIEIGPIKDILSSPFRYFYQYRNYIWMLGRGYVPMRWKVNVGCKCVLRLFYLPFYTRSCGMIYINIFKGICSGLFKSRKV